LTKKVKNVKGSSAVLPFSDHLRWQKTSQWVRVQ